MNAIRQQKNLKPFQWALALTGIGLLFWWPLSHFFYPLWYHRLLGFANPGQYIHNPFIIVIGFGGLFPVLMLLYSAIDPIRNRDMVLILSLGSFLGGVIYVYLISNKLFPINEVLNVAMLFTAAFLLLFSYFRINKFLKETNDGH
ncbi:MAG: hypothetical protein ACOYYS_03295 [Chloroflexota bacterium]